MLWVIREYILLFFDIAAFLAAIEIGFRFGRRYKAGHDKELATHVGALQTAILGLLALLLSFTFAMSISRFDTRREMVLEEANAIKATYLRAQFLPVEQKEEVSRLLKIYLDARVDFYKTSTTPARMKDAAAKAANVKDQLWTIAVNGMQNARVPVAVSLFAQSLNAMIDANEKRYVALENHVPDAVIVLLIFVATVGMGFIGYGYGLTDKRRHGSTALFAVLIAVVLTVILDIDRPQRGFIRVNEGSLLRLQQALEQDSETPVPGD
ncbi:MAG: hypothetical protein AB7H77_01970 [Bdellovibrionales bacterium]